MGGQKLGCKYRGLEAQKSAALREWQKNSVWCHERGTGSEQGARAEAGGRGGPLIMRFLKDLRALSQGLNFVLKRTRSLQGFC